VQLYHHALLKTNCSKYVPTGYQRKVTRLPQIRVELICFVMFFRTIIKIHHHRSRDKTRPLAGSPHSQVVSGIILCAHRQRVCSRSELSILLIHTWRASVIPVDISYGEAESNGGVVSETCHSHMCPFSPPFAGSSLVSERLCLYGRLDCPRSTLVGTCRDCGVGSSDLEYMKCSETGLWGQRAL
jgi:hypothetical protein